MEEPTLSYIDKKNCLATGHQLLWRATRQNSVDSVPPEQEQRIHPKFAECKDSGIPRTRDTHLHPILQARGKFVYGTTHTNQRTLLSYTCVIPQSGENRCLFYLQGFPLYPQSFNCMEQELVVCLCDFLFQLLSIIKVLQ